MGDRYQALTEMMEAINKLVSTSVLGRCYDRKLTYRAPKLRSYGKCYGIDGWVGAFVRHPETSLSQGARLSVGSRDMVQFFTDSKRTPLQDVADVLRVIQ